MGWIMWRTPELPAQRRLQHGHPRYMRLQERLHRYPIVDRYRPLDRIVRRGGMPCQRGQSVCWCVQVQRWQPRHDHVERRGVEQFVRSASQLPG